LKSFDLARNSLFVMELTENSGPNIHIEDKVYHSKYVGAIKCDLSFESKPA